MLIRRRQTHWSGPAVEYYYDEGDPVRLGFFLYVPDALDGITYYHLVPVAAGAETRVYIDGDAAESDVAVTGPAIWSRTADVEFEVVNGVAVARTLRAGELVEDSCPW